jgi:hypothetical protein
VIYAANTKWVSCFVFRAVRNFIIEWAETLDSVAIRRSTHISDRKSENLSERVFWLFLICHLTERLRWQFGFFEQNPARRWRDESPLVVRALALLLRTRLFANDSRARLLKDLWCVMAKIILGLDSICPTGVGKVAGVKIGIHEEMWVGGAEGIRLRQMLPPSQCYGGTSRRDKLARFELWSAAINGISREKAPSVAKLPPSLKPWWTGWRNYRVIRGFSRCRFTGQRRGQGNDGRRIGAWEQAEHFALSQAWQPMIRCGLMTRNWSK